MEMTISTLIKILLVVFGIVIIIGGIGLFFTNNFFGFVDNLPDEEEQQVEKTPVGELQAPKGCLACGEGAFNLCDKKECEELNKQLQIFYASSGRKDDENLGEQEYCEFETKWGIGFCNSPE